MTQWLKRKLRNWLNSEDESIKLEPARLSIGSPRTLDQHGFNFTVYPAQGGTVIELRAYDDRHDRHNNKLYVITDQQDLGKELDHIITLEALVR